MHQKYIRSASLNHSFNYTFSTNIFSTLSSINFPNVFLLVQILIFLSIYSSVFKQDLLVSSSLDWMSVTSLMALMALMDLMSRTVSHIKRTKHYKMYTFSQCLHKSFNFFRNDRFVSVIHWNPFAIYFYLFITRIKRLNWKPLKLIRRLDSSFDNYSDHSDSLRFRVL